MGSGPFGGRKADAAAAAALLLRLPVNSKTMRDCEQQNPEKVLLFTSGGWFMIPKKRLEQGYRMELRFSGLGDQRAFGIFPGSIASYNFMFSNLPMHG